MNSKIWTSPWCSRYSFPCKYRNGSICRVYCCPESFSLDAVVVNDSAVITQWILVNLFVVILVDNFTKCFAISKMDIQEEHVEQFKKVWSEGFTDPGGPFGKKRFTEPPECKTIDVRMLEELVPQLLPATETLDHGWAERPSLWSRFNMGKEGISPLGLIVPHRNKQTQMATPFDIDQMCHVGGKLCEIVSRQWDSQQAQDQGVSPSTVVVRFIESEPISSDRVLSLDHLHVPAVEHFTGFLDGDEAQGCEITWVSNDRQTVRVRFTSNQRKRFASSKIERTMSEAPSWIQTGAGDADELERLQEEYHSPEEQAQRERAAVLLQARARGWLHRSEMELAREREELAASAVAFKIGDEKVESFPSSEVLRVTLEGDEQWMNRLVVELGIRQQEAVDGFRYLPPNVSITDEKGRFVPLVVGLRALADGTFVQDIEVGFHELLMALCLIPSSCKQPDLV